MTYLSTKHHSRGRLIHTQLASDTAVLRSTISNSVHAILALNGPIMSQMLTAADYCAYFEIEHGRASFRADMLRCLTDCKSSGWSEDARSLRSMPPHSILTLESCGCFSVNFRAETAMREGNPFLPRRDLLWTYSISRQRPHDAHVHDSTVCSYSTNDDAKKYWVKLPLTNARHLPGTC
jgi:hypothetical protein